MSSHPVGADGWARRRRRRAGLLYAAFAAVALWLVAPALHGPFLGDDAFYVVDNPFIESLSLASIAALWAPGGAASLYVVNYAPVHLLAHAFERAAFGFTLWPYHVVNALVHALDAFLLVALLRRVGVAKWAAVIGGVFFLVHPANVEAVATISQLKTTLSMAFALGALLWLRERPAVAAGLFAAALLTKASAVFALPMAAALLWSGGAPRRAWQGLAVWGGLFALYAIPEFEAFRFGGQHEVAAYESPLVQLRTVASVGMHYLVMAATSLGVGPYQEFAPVRNPLDPWWLVSIPVTGLLGWRIVSTLRRRSPEAAFWLGAAAAFAPVSQIFPFLHPVADRYLYPILPGLIGGVLLAAGAWRGWGITSKARLGGGFRLVMGLLLAAVLVGFSVRSIDQARLWATPFAALEVAAGRFPDGSIAWYLRAREAAARGDVDASVAALEEASARAGSAHPNYVVDTAFAQIRSAPKFRAYARTAAGNRLSYVQDRGLETQHWLRVQAHDHLVREEFEAALARLEQARRVGGPRDAEVLAEIEATRDLLLALKRGDPLPTRFRHRGAVPADR